MNDRRLHPISAVPLAIEQGDPLIALAGQPNVGKSTIFNILTGLNQHVGNWPGKTVERREGHFTSGDHAYRLVDLPGTYSLTANSPEEVIAREFILRERPDAVIAVVNAATLERSLYLVAELIALPSPLIVVLNMMDVAAQEGLHIEPQVLEAALGVPVVVTTATRSSGVRDVLHVLNEVLSGQRLLTPRKPEIRADHRAALDEILNQISAHVPELYPPDWLALKLLEGDTEITHALESALPPENWQAVLAILRQHDDALLAVASGRYEWIGRMVRAAVVQPKMGQISWTKQIDQVAAHPVWGLFVLGGILGVVFWLTFAIGAPVQAWLDTRIVGGLAGLAAQYLAGAPAWFSGFVVNGILGGAGAVVTFLPIMVIFFAVFGLLEDTGYMARAAYVMDNLMHVMGLHGRSFLPLFLGFGCNVPAVLGTRVIDSKPARLLTTLIAPLVPCSARMAVVAFLAPAFFGSKALLVSWSSGALLDAYPGRYWLASEPVGVQGPTLGIHHGDAAVSSAQHPDDRHPGLAALGLICQKGRDHHPRHGARDLGAVCAARRRFRPQLPCAIGQARGTRGALDGLRLALDGRTDKQFPGQRERHRHAWRPVWQQPQCRAG